MEAQQVAQAANAVGTVDVAVLVVLITAVLEFAKYVIGKLVAKKDDAGSLNAEQARQLQFLFDAHNKYDLDGSPLWYVPRSWAATQKEVVEMLQEVAKVQQETLRIIEGLAKNRDRE